MGMPGTTAQASEAISQIPPVVWRALSEERPSAVTLLNLVRDGVPLYMVIPLILVIGTAIKGYSTLVCIASGIVSSLILGS